MVEKKRKDKSCKIFLVIKCCLCSTKHFDILVIEQLFLWSEGEKLEHIRLINKSVSDVH